MPEFFQIKKPLILFHISCIMYSFSAVKENLPTDVFALSRRAKVKSWNIFTIACRGRD